MSKNKDFSSQILPKELEVDGYTIHLPLSTEGFMHFARFFSKVMSMIRWDILADKLEKSNDISSTVLAGQIIFLIPYNKEDFYQFLASLLRIDAKDVGDIPATTMIKLVNAILDEESLGVLIRDFFDLSINLMGNLSKEKTTKKAGKS